VKHWTRVLYCEPSPLGDVFTLLERARGSRTIRRSAVMRLTEADARRALAAMGETGAEIDAMIAQARVRELEAPRPAGSPHRRDE
jgi:hypothetical protein